MSVCNSCKAALLVLWDEACQCWTAELSQELHRGRTCQTYKTSPSFVDKSNIPSNFTRNC